MAQASKLEVKPLSEVAWDVELHLGPWIYNFCGNSIWCQFQDTAQCASWREPHAWFRSGAKQHHQANSLQCKLAKVASGMRRPFSQQFMRSMTGRAPQP